jgi:SAM-dependent methyltransferase
MNDLQRLLSENYCHQFFLPIHQSTGEYDNFAAHYHNSFLSLLPSSRDSRILDLGCGLGHFLYFLKKEGYGNHAGIDIGDEQIAYCREHVTHAVEVVTDAASYLNAHPGEFDAVVSLDVLEHLDDEELLRVTRGIRNALKEDGRLIIKVPNAACISALMTRYGDLTHRRLFTEGSIRQLLRAVGFDEIDVRPHEKRHVPEFASRFQRWRWQAIDWYIRWTIRKFYEHVMEGAIPSVQTINLLVRATRRSHT